MGRRSSHTPDQLRELILESTRTIIATEGLVGLSAREIARRIDYSAGTIYNVFENLDDLLMTVQIEMLADAVAYLEQARVTSNPRADVENLARRYVDFALQRKRLWNLLFQHHLPNGKHAPPVLHEKINSLIAIVGSALQRLMPDKNAADIDRSARILWAAVHGVSAIAVTDKSPTMTSETAQWYTVELIKATLDGLLNL